MDRFLLKPKVELPSAGTIGVLTSEDGRWSKFWAHLLRLQKPGQVKLEYKCSTNVAQARNEIAEGMVGDWLWFIDDDHTFEPDILKRLLARDVDIVQPVVLSRQPPYAPVAMGEQAPVPDKPSVIGHRRKVLSPGDAGMREAEVVGCGGMLIRKRVLDAMEKPWFRTGELCPDLLSEDIGFCRRAKEKGFRIWEDLDNPIGHLVGMELWPKRMPTGAWQTEVRALNGRFAFLLPPATMAKDEETGEDLVELNQG